MSALLLKGGIGSYHDRGWEIYGDRDRDREGDWSELEVSSLLCSHILVHLSVYDVPTKWQKT